MKNPILLLTLVTTLLFGCSTFVQTTAPQQPVRYATEVVDGLNIFYREAGHRKNPTLVLLHGFPSSSHMYRKVLAQLSDDYHLIAPDYPGFGDSSFPSRTQFKYSFDSISRVIERFLEQKGISQFYIMIQDYGAPIGFRIATRNPKKILGIITQNGNAYEEGINKKTWAPIMQYWKKKSRSLEKEIAKSVFSLEGLRWQYTHGTRKPGAILPDNWNLDYMKLSRPGQHQVQLDLFYDYQNNLKLYPQWQQYLRENQPPVLVVWGREDAFFPKEGAEGFKKDVQDLDYHLLNTGHFALEEDGDLIIRKIRAFLDKRS